MAKRQTGKVLINTTALTSIINSCDNCINADNACVRNSLKVVKLRSWWKVLSKNTIISIGPQTSSNTKSPA